MLGLQVVVAVGSRVQAQLPSCTGLFAPGVTPLKSPPVPMDPEQTSQSKLGTAGSAVVVGDGRVLTVLNCGRGPTDHFPREHLCGLLPCAGQTSSPFAPPATPHACRASPQAASPLSRADQFIRRAWREAPFVILSR